MTENANLLAKERGVGSGCNRAGRAAVATVLLEIGVALATVLLGLGVALANPAAAQTVSGAVLDADTEAPVAGVDLVLRSATGLAVARAQTAEDGLFSLMGRAPGAYTLEVERLGYSAVPPQQLELERELVEVEVRLSREPIALDPLTVTGRRHDPRHDATLEGALVRHEQLPPVGPRRVMLRSDPRFSSAGRVGQVLRWFGPASGCITLVRDGLVEPFPEAIDDLWIDSPTDWWEAIEFYRRWDDAPLGLRSIAGLPGCSVVALWSRQDPLDTGRPLWQRGLGLGVFLGFAYWLTSLLI